MSTGPRAPESSRADDLLVAYSRYAEADYSARWAADNPGNDAIVRERHRALGELTSSWRIPTMGPVDVLDLGCGSSTRLPQRPAAGYRVGVDLLFERVAASRESGPTEALLCADGVALPLRSDCFDAVVLSTVLSSVLQKDIRALIARECDRVLVPGGAVIWYDMRIGNPRNQSTAALRRRDVEELFPSFDARWTSLTVIPPLARRLGRWTRVGYPALARLPFLRSHLAGILVKPSP